MLLRVRVSKTIFLKFKYEKRLKLLGDCAPRPPLNSYPAGILSRTPKKVQYFIGMLSA